MLNFFSDLELENQTSSETEEESLTSTHAETISEVSQNMDSQRVDSLGDLEDQESSKPKINQEALDDKGRSYATGKKKRSVARIWIKPGGSGRIFVNKRDERNYFCNETQRSIIVSPFAYTQRSGMYDVISTVKGGGVSSQAYALRHGISKALQCVEPSLREELKSNGFLTRDPRRVERKKPGLRKARRRRQFSKR